MCIRDRTAERHLQALPAPLRQLLDMLRMTACRAATAMAKAVAPALDHPDTARSLLKSVFQGAASLHPDPAAGTLEVRLLHRPTCARDRALEPLLDELNRTRTLFPGTHLRLVCNFLSATEPSPSPATKHPSITDPLLLPDNSSEEV